MISIAMLGGGAVAASYYLDRAADCELAGYYVSGVERSGRWCGRGAAALGLAGRLPGGSETAFAGLLDGRLPDGVMVARPVPRQDRRGLLPVAPLLTELRRAADARGVAVGELFDDPALARVARALDARCLRGSGRDLVVGAERVAALCDSVGLDPQALYPGTGNGAGFAAALAHAGQTVDVRRSGLDVVVSAPKSVSVLHALGGPSVAGTVLAAHEQAVAEALDYLDRHAGHGLRGHQGGDRRAWRIPTQGLVVAAFTHHTSRADDPQLHTHLVIANLVRGVDGQWSAVDSRAVHRHARTAGYVYQAVLRGELTRELGVDWGPVRNGIAEVVGIPGQVLRAFSTRRREIEGELARTGGSGRRAAQRAAYRTRPVKTHTAERQLRHGWTQRLRELGFRPDDLLAASLARRQAPAWPPLPQSSSRLLGPDGLTEHATSFDRRDVLQALTQTLPSGLPVTGRQLEAATALVLRERDAVALLRPDGDTEDGPRWTTAGLLATEQAVLGIADRPCAVPALDLAAVEPAGAAHLTVEQRAVVSALLRSNTTIGVVAGPAGSGKTALLQVAFAGWRGAGVNVLGCALAAVTARRLQSATGMPATSLARLLAGAARPDPTTGRPAGLPAGTVVVVDEAGMVGTRDLAALVSRVGAAGGRLVLVGDPAQLPEIDAGGLFAALAARSQPFTISSNQRQAQDWERDALQALRQGHTADALRAYLAHGRIRTSPDDAQARAELVDAYLHLRRGGHGTYQVVALASSRADAAALNSQIRDALAAAGLIGLRSTAVPGDEGVRRFADGDLVVITRNDHRRGLLNGTRAIVEHGGRSVLRLHTETGQRVDVPASWAVDHLDHGYALTVHKAQGLTVETALVYGTAALNRQAGYVALSRGRAGTYLFTSHESLTRATSTHELDVPRPPVPAYGDAGDALDALQQRLDWSRRHVLAHHQQPAERLEDRGLSR